MQVAVVVEPVGEIRGLIVFEQAAIAVGRDGPTPGERLRAQMPQFDHVARCVVIVCFLVVEDGIRIRRGSIVSDGMKRGFLGLPTAGADQLAQGVVAVEAGGLDTLVLEVADRQGMIVDLQDIADRVDLVLQILQGCRPRQPGGQ